MKKNTLGQFFTKKNFWRRKQIINFMKKYNFNKIMDPFAGEGDLLENFNNFTKIGMDIDKNLNKNWIYNDSLRNIPFIDDCFIITNPPYLSKTSSKRKGILHKSFNTTHHNDLYKIALDRLIESKIPGVVILPESFINSTYNKKHIFSITILIPNPFKDTEVPVCIVCYDPNKSFSNVKIYKNDTFLGYRKSLEKIKNTILKKKNEIKIKFNDESGKLALVAYDSLSGRKIRFMKSKNLNYNKPQKISSRVVSKIKVNIYVSDNFINNINEILKHYRNETNDVFLTPFKGNNIFNERRRRLDYKTARLIINSTVM